MTLQLRRDTAANWTSANPTLAAGQPGYETDTGRVKIGDGSTAWTSLAYRFESGGGGVSDGDKGDITVSSSGTVWTIDAATVTLSKMANLAASTILGNNTGAGATPIALTPTQVKTLLAIAAGDVSGLAAVATSGSASDLGSGTLPVGRLSFTKAQLDTIVSDGNVQFVGDTPTAHTHLLAAGATDVTITAANLNALDDGVDTALHFHDTDRARANHTGTQTASTISDFNEAAQDAVGAMVDASLTYVDGTPLLQRAALTGAVTAAAGSNATSLGSFTKAQLDAAVSDGNVLYVGDVTSNATHTGDVTGSGALTIAADVVTNAKLANVATATIKGRATAGTGDPEDLTGTQATALLDAFTSGAKGLAPASGGGTANFLRADGTWAAPAGGGGGSGPPQIMSWVI